MPAITGSDRIDVHVHIELDQYKAGVKAAGGDPSGWQAPEWSVESALAEMKATGTAKHVFSITSPGPSVVGATPAGRALTRALNEEQAAIVKKHPESFAFFASVPSLADVEGAIAEIEYGLTTLKAAGVVLMTSYDDKLLGDPLFQPIWKKLDDLKAIVFIHPTAVDIKPKHIAGLLPQPTIDYPHQTTRTAVDLVLSRTFATHPNVKIILSHAGGSLPYLSDRVVKTMGVPQVSARVGLTGAEVKRDFQRFYLDTAVSTSRSQLYAMLAFTTPDRILFGSDWPYAPHHIAVELTSQLDEFSDQDPMGKLLAGVNSANAKKLFGW